MMTEYIVDVTLSVEADSEAEALEKARENIAEGFGEAEAFKEEEE